MTPDIPLRRFRVLPDWVDYNGHMGDYAYGIVFSQAVTALMDEIGLDESYRTENEATLYTLEMRIGYQRECHEGAPLSLTTRVLGVDAKRIHLYQEMLGSDGSRLAWCEQVLLHVARAGGTPRAAPFPPAAVSRLGALETAQRGAARPAWLDRRTGLG